MKRVDQKINKIINRKGTTTTTVAWKPLLSQLARRFEGSEETVFEVEKGQCVVQNRSLEVIYMMGRKEEVKEKAQKKKTKIIHVWEKRKKMSLGFLKDANFAD